MNNYMWNYIDTVKATIKAIEDYPSVKKLFILLKSNTQHSNDDMNIYRMNQADLFLNWFEPSWNLLDDDSKAILKEYYMGGNLKSGAGVRLQFKLHYSERHIQRLKEKALSELSLYLFGKKQK